MQLKQFTTYLYSVLATLLLASTVHGETDRLYQVGVSLGSNTWSGDNGTTGSEAFESETRSLGFQFSMRQGKWYAGVGFNLAEYEFEDAEPDREPVTGPSSSVNPKVGVNQFDLTGGYYVWPQVSLFVGLKSYGLDWIDQEYKVNYSGLGGGVSGFYPINNDWIFYGSLGITSVNAQSDNEEVGSGQANTLELGFMYQLKSQTAITIGIKSQHIEVTYDNGDTQLHELGGLNVAVQHRFAFD